MIGSRRQLGYAEGWHTFSGKVLAPRSLKASLKRLFSPLLRASLIAIGVSADGAQLVDAMINVRPLLIVREEADDATKKAGVSGTGHSPEQSLHLSRMLGCRRSRTLAYKIHLVRRRC